MPISVEKDGVPKPWVSVIFWHLLAVLTFASHINHSGSHSSDRKCLYNLSFSDKPIMRSKRFVKVFFCFVKLYVRIL